MDEKMFYKQQVLEKNAIFLLRVWVGVIFIHHGLSIWHQSNMHGFAATLKTENIPFPVLSAYLCKATEFFGGIFLVLGFLKRPACIPLIINMTVATFVFGKGQLLQNGMTPFIVLICCLTILLSPSDKLSIDWLIYKNKKKGQNQ